jgi:hypothetical protein
MATAQIAFTDKQLEAELQAEKREFGRLQEKLRVELRTLDAAKGEHNRVVVAIENGAAGKETDFSRAKTDVETAEIRCQGLQKLIAPIEAKISELTEELRRRETAAAKRAREKELGDRTEKLKVRLLKIRETLALLCAGELFTAEQERAMIASEFGDIGGMEIAEALTEILFKAAPPSEGMRNPEVHLEQLNAAGLVPFGFEIVRDLLPSTVQGEPQRLRVRLRPGPALQFTILPMGPRAS